jgi:YD repeat-containing protein
LSYGYDELGRLTCVVYTDGAKVTYGYDAAGNRTQLTVAASGTCSQGTAGGNQPPKAQNDTVSAAPSGPTVLSPSPLANDTDPDGDTLSIVGVGTPAHGQRQFTGTSITYTPQTGFSGPDHFGYTISDGHNHTATAQITVNVAANQPPVAVDDNISTTENVDKSFDPTANDTDPEGDPRSVQSVGAPMYGSIVGFSANQITYHPAANFVGSDSFSYTINDGHGNTASAHVYVSISLPPPPPPIAHDVNNWSVNAGTTNNDVPLNFTQSQPSNVYVGQPPPSLGMAQPSGFHIYYTPTVSSGTDSFGYYGTNAGGQSNTATVTLTIIPGNSVHVTPTPTWGVILNDGPPNSVQGDNDGGTQQLNGFNVPITLKLNVLSPSQNPTGATVTFYYNKNSAGWTPWTSGTTITVSSGNTLAFRVNLTVPGTFGSAGGSIQILNTSDSSTEIGNFTYNLSITQ